MEAPLALKVEILSSHTHAIQFLILSFHQSVILGTCQHKIIQEESIIDSELPCFCIDGTCQEGLNRERTPFIHQSPKG